ncbi:Hypothetical protein CINCED_3A008444 [Cinara cedri]|nr:Hypothetical protein CINCED_3A008444 [Cinara cedri]
MNRNIMKNKKSGSDSGTCSFTSSPIIKRFKRNDDSFSTDKLPNESDEEHNNLQSPSIKNTPSQSWLEECEDLSRDLGNYLNKTVVSDDAKFSILELSNIPKNKFVYPYSIHPYNGIQKKRFLKKNHFEEFKWLVYSEKAGGVFCKYCVLFAKFKGSEDKNMAIKSLVTVPLTKYAKIIGKNGYLIKHQQNMYHMNAVLTTIDFLIHLKNPKKGIINIVDTSQVQPEGDDGCLRLSPIVDIKKVVLNGRQNISLEGHQDQNQHNKSVVNKENVIISAGETILGNQLQITNSKPTNMIQEQIINRCKDKIVPNILEKVKASYYYSIIFNETTDVFHNSKISLILRTINSVNIVDESFISFIDCYDCVYGRKVVNEDLDKDLHNNEPNSGHDLMEPKLTGELLGNIVVDKLKEFTFDLNNCIGIGTDKCSVMTSVMQCAVQQIQKSCINALHSTFSNRVTNLSIFKSSNVQLVRNNVGTVIEVLSFFNSSPKRNIVLKNSLKNKRSLTLLCETKWIECHDSIFEFQVNLKNIIICLESISEWNEQVSSSKAKCLLNAVCNCEFVVTLFALSNILCVTSAAGKLFQGVGFDLDEANNCIDNIITTIENKHTNSKIIFNNIFEECKIFMTELDIDIKLPRAIKQQIQRYNTPASFPEEYYRRVLFIPILENTIENLKVQFLNDKNKTIFILMQLIPINFIKTSSKARSILIETVIKQYSFLNFNIYSLKGELELWTTKWDDKMCKGLQVPTNAFDAIEECPHVMFPSLRKILFILCTLPVSVATTEFSFSTLPR